MFTKRIIPCLDVKNGRVVKGVNFVDLKDAGDPVEIAKAYDKAGADELVFLDITASSDDRGTVVDMVRKVAECVFIPFTVGGGIRTVDDFRALLREGADKSSFNSSAINTSELFRDAAEKFGLKLGGGSGLNHRGPFSGQVTGGGQTAEPFSRLLQILHDILIIPSSDLKIRVQVKRRGGGRETDDIARFGSTARQLDGVLHTVGVQDGQAAPGKAIALADGLLDAGAGSAHQHQRLDVGENLRGQRLIGDLFVVAARNQDELLVEGV